LKTTFILLDEAFDGACIQPGNLKVTLILGLSGFFFETCQMGVTMLSYVISLPHGLMFYYPGLLRLFGFQSAQQLLNFNLTRNAFYEPIWAYCVEYVQSLTN
jgi:hypothetical protein